MDFHTLVTFALVAGITIITPGPAVLLSIRNGIAFGLRSVLWSGLGNICGVFCLSAAAMCGLGAVMKSSTVVFSVVQLMGAGYLLYLGIRSLRSGAASLPVLAETRPGDTPANRRLFVEAFLTAVSNPKALLFFTALFPQFVKPGQPLVSQFFWLTGIFMTIAYATHLVYAAAASRTRTFLRRPVFSLWLNRAVGVTFIMFAVGLLSFRRPGA